MISEFILATILTTVLVAVSIALNKQINETAKMHDFQFSGNSFSCLKNTPTIKATLSAFVAHARTISRILIWIFHVINLL